MFDHSEEYSSNEYTLNHDYTTAPCSPICEEVSD